MGRSRRRNGMRRKTEKSVPNESVVATFGKEADWSSENIYEEEKDLSNSAGLTRGQRKRQKRHGAFLKKMGLVTRLSKAHDSKEKEKIRDGAFADLKELKDSLSVDNTTVAGVATKKLKKRQSTAQRRKMAALEVKQLVAVKTHPAFIEDPFLAIKTHLCNTLLAPLSVAHKATAT